MNDFRTIPPPRALLRRWHRRTLNVEPEGRHRPGKPAERVYRQVFDSDRYEQADQLNAAEPRWLVFYQPHRQRICAIAMFDVDPRDQPVLEAATPAVLQRRMRDAEACCRLGEQWAHARRYLPLGGAA